MHRLLLVAGWLTAYSLANLQPPHTTAHKDLTTHNPLAMVLYTARGCHTCDEVWQTLEPLQSRYPDIPIGKVNCTADPQTCDEARVFAVPKLTLSVGEDEVVTNREGWTESGIVLFLERQVGDTVTAITDVDQERFSDPTTISIVASIAPSDVESMNVFRKVAERWRRHYSFFSLETADVVLGKETVAPTLTLYKPFDGRKSIYHGSFQTSDIESFLQVETVPLIDESDPLLYDEHIASGLPLAHIWGPAEECSKLATALYPLADRMRSQMTFITADSHQNPSMGERLKLGEDAVRGFAIEDVQTTRKYPMKDAELSATAIAEFVEQYLAGKVEPTIDSEMAYNDTNLPVMRVTGMDFKSIVFDSSRDVLVHFGVPYFDYCTELHDQMKRLGQRYLELGLSDKVTIARVDMSVNEVPLRITEYPTIKLWRAGDNEVRSFNGSYHELLTVEQLAEFVRAEGSGKVSLSLMVDDGRAVKDEL